MAKHSPTPSRSTQILTDTAPAGVESGQGGNEIGTEPGEVVRPLDSLPKAGDEGLNNVGPPTSSFTQWADPTTWESAHCQVIQGGI